MSPVRTHPKITLLSWMLTQSDGQVRLVLADDVLVEMRRRFDEEWWVDSVSLFNDVKVARLRAVHRTEVLEDGGFRLDGNVITATADIEASALYTENMHRGRVGPILQGLFTLLWREI